MAAPHALTPVILRLIDTLENALPEADARRIRELVDANQPHLALEWIADAVTQYRLQEPSLQRLLLQLATQLGITASIRERLGGG